MKCKNCSKDAVTVDGYCSDTECVEYWEDQIMAVLGPAKPCAWQQNIDATLEDPTLPSTFVTPKEAETAAKPSRYAGNKLEYWDAARDLGWDYFQATIGKYIHRYKKKHGPEDLCKAINFTVKLLANETGADYYELMKLTPEELGKRFKK